MEDKAKQHSDFPIVKGRKKHDPKAVNYPCSFDIETCSFYLSKDGKEFLSIPDFYKLTDRRKIKKFEKRGCLVAWGFGVNGEMKFGRTWEEFIDYLKELQSRFNLDPANLILPVYVHNLSYEFQWFRKRLKWVSVFATGDRQPIRALCEYGIEFRDSLILSGYSLDKTAKSLLKYKVDKLIGNWDYYALRGHLTPLTDEEWDYLNNDNVIVMNYIRELMEDYKSVNRIPMTKTGFVREDVRNACFWDRKSHKKDHNNKFIEYQRLMRSCVFVSEQEQMMLRLSFAGGFTHASSLNAGIVLEDVTSMDLTSSYPTIMVSEKFPMGRGKEVEPKSKEEFEAYLKAYCCLMDITFYDIKSSFVYEHIISRSKCIEQIGVIADNGRIIKADMIRIIVTEVDIDCFRRFYKWKNFRINKMYVYVKDYLPKAICEKVIEYYEQKTTLKGVEGKESEYAKAKTMINAIFGMCVYDPLKDEITYSDDEWGKKEGDRKEMIEQYNNSKSRFLSYHWGVWITAYGRRNIFSAQLELKEDYIYTDTDSVKYLNAPKHEKFFIWYNDLISRKIRKCLQYHGIDVSRANPKSIDGINHPLGCFDFDGHYARFCTLGAKRYAVDYGEEAPEAKRYSLTISGVNKSVAIPSIIKKMKENGKDFFDYFQFGIEYDRETCGKKLHTYIDERTTAKFKDMYGIEHEIEEESFVHLEDTTYKMTTTDEYYSLLNEFHSIKYID